MNNEITSELEESLKKRNKITSIEYDLILNEKKDDIVEYYKFRILNKLKDESLIEIMAETMEHFEIDEIDMLNVLKDDEGLLHVIKYDCLIKNMLKEKDKHINVGDIFK